MIDVWPTAPASPTHGEMHMNFARALMRLFGLLFGFAPAMLFAATITVTTTGDGAGACVGQSCPTLRAALSKATNGDTITFAAAIDGQTILLANPNYDAATANPQEFGASKFFITGNSGLRYTLVSALQTIAQR